MFTLFVSFKVTANNNTTNKVANQFKSIAIISKELTSLEFNDLFCEYIINKSFSNKDNRIELVDNTLVLSLINLNNL